jgi:hypothetical protein
MKYLCLICAEKDYMMEFMSEEIAERHFEEYADFTEGIKKNGNFIGANRLQPPETAVTVRVRNGKVSTTDGPYAETKEQLGGYYLIDAKDIHEAVEIASKIPGGRFGCVEVRPVAEDEPTLSLGF